MKPQRSAHTDPQRELFRVELNQLVDPRHSLVQLADQIHWEQFQTALAPLFSDADGRPACAVRLMIGLHYLKHSFDLSDEATLASPQHPSSARS